MLKLPLKQKVSVILVINICRWTPSKCHFLTLVGCKINDSRQYETSERHTSLSWRWRKRQFAETFFYPSSMPFFYLAHSYFRSVIASLFQTTPVWPSYFLSLVHNHSSISPCSPSNSPLILSLSLSCLLLYHRRIHPHSFFVSRSSPKSLCSLSCLCSVMMFVSEPLRLCSVILLSRCLPLFLPINSSLVGWTC